MQQMIEKLAALDIGELYNGDFLLTWDKKDDEIRAILTIANILKDFREGNISAKVFDSGLGISQFRDNSTRTRFSFSSACNFLGLGVQDLDEGKSQIAHGETIRETSNMISFMADVIGIRDDLYIGKGHTYMKEVAGAVDRGYEEGVLEQRPAVINLQCDIDHPTQSMSDLLHLAGHFGGLENLAGKKIAMTWAYSPSYGKPLSVPQGIIGLLTRFGMNVALAHPKGYNLLENVVEQAGGQAAESGGTFSLHESLDDAFENADIVYPKSWAPYAVMEERTSLVESGSEADLQELEKRCLADNAKHTDWECGDRLMNLTNDALYLHCLPADISGVSCVQGEVTAEVLNKFKVPLYKQAGFKPYVIAAMIFAARIADPVKILEKLLSDSIPRTM
ncbi:MAG: knotted carbamoyltransferase YgeW [Spirochaetales bacterium]|jgi:knotted carbamoyltransferase YgeW|nr:knotted carbamoyltransferase YgeW [Spirochaetales bacterium]